MKILFYISTIRGGGAARVMVNLANGLAVKHNILLVTNFSDNHEYSTNSNIKRINLEPIEITGNVVKKNLKRIKALRQTIKKERPDVCIAFMRENNFRLIVASFCLHIKTVVSVRNDPAREYSGWGNRILANFLYSKADGVIFQTEEAKTWFKRKIQMRSQVIFNQVDDSFFFKNDCYGDYIMACGRISNQKNYPLLIKAFSNVIKNFPNEQLNIYGEGELKEDLKKMCEELQLEENVHFMGYNTDMQDIYRHAKFLVLTSNYEGLPNVLLEALASSVPVISTDCPCGGPKMIINNGENGLLVPLGDEKGLTNAMICLISDKNRLIQMRKNAFRSSERFKSENVLNVWNEYIASIVN